MHIKINFAFFAVYLFLTVLFYSCLCWLFCKVKLTFSLLCSIFVRMFEVCLYCYRKYSQKARSLKLSEMITSRFWVIYGGPMRFMNLLWTNQYQTLIPDTTWNRTRWGASETGCSCTSWRPAAPGSIPPWPRPLMKTVRILYVSPYLCCMCDLYADDAYM